MTLFVVLAVVVLTGEVLATTSNATCVDPVTGDEVDVGSYFKLPIRYGQFLWFSSPGSLKRFTGSALQYQVDAHAGPLKDHRGLPDLDGHTIRCPMCGSNLTVNPSTPRVQLQHGQNIYFKCWGCVNMFLADPTKVLGEISEGPGMHCKEVGGPPPGPKDLAYCPVTGKKINMTENKFWAEFGFDQKLHVSDGNARAELTQNLASYFLGAHDFPRQVGPQGSPDMRGQKVNDPEGTAGAPIEITMKTPRIQFRHGQNLYFASYDSLNAFWNKALRPFASSLVV